ncbi:MAG: hypothetical protein N2595_00435 [bacterium]|nr:hypothetical protein [bacterium]
MLTLLWHWIEARGISAGVERTGVADLAEVGVVEWWRCSEISAAGAGLLDV